MKRLSGSLTEHESIDPFLAIDEIFDFAQLPDAKELLWEWLKATVTGTFHKNLSASERYAIISLYEKLNKLLDATHILHTARSKKEPVKRLKKHS